MSRLNSVALLLVAFVIVSSAAFADTVTYVNLEFTTPTFGFSIPTPDNVIVTNASSGLYPGYVLSAEFCENSSCATPIATTYQSLLRLTDLTLTCDSEGGCGLIDIDFQANVAEFGATPVGESVVTVNLNLDGSSPADINGAVNLCISNHHSICTSTLSGPHSFETTFSGVGGSVTGSTSGQIVALSGFTVYGQLEVDALNPGQSLTLLNSLDIGVGVEAVPEPATFGLVAAALLLFGLAYWRKTAKT